MWQEKPILKTPRGFEGESPIYEVIKSYFLEIGDEKIEVERVFALARGDFLRIFYCGKEYLEELIVCDRKITHASATLVKKLVDLPSSDLPEEEFFRRLQEFFSQPQARITPPTYHHIKRFEHHLLELPWQKDLSAIYNGNGIFRI